MLLVAIIDMNSDGIPSGSQDCATSSVGPGENNGAGKHGGEEKAGRRGDENSNCPPGLGGLLKELNNGGSDECMLVKFVEDTVCPPFRSNTMKQSKSSQNAGFLKDSPNAAISDAEILNRLGGMSNEVKVVECVPNANC